MSLSNVTVNGELRGSEGQTVTFVSELVELFNDDLLSVEVVDR
jgi:hypothetical protein